MASNSSTVVEHSIHNPKIQGSNPAIDAGRNKYNKNIYQIDDQATSNTKNVFEQLMKNKIFVEKIEGNGDNFNF